MSLDGQLSDELEEEPKSLLEDVRKNMESFTEEIREYAKSVQGYRGASSQIRVFQDRIHILENIRKQKQAEMVLADEKKKLDSMGITEDNTYVMDGETSLHEFVANNFEKLKDKRFIKRYHYIHRLDESQPTGVEQKHCFAATGTLHWKEKVGRPYEGNDIIGLSIQSLDPDICRSEDIEELGKMIEQAENERKYITTQAMRHDRQQFIKENGIMPGDIYHISFLRGDGKEKEIRENIAEQERAGKGKRFVCINAGWIYRAEDFSDEKFMMKNCRLVYKESGTHRRLCNFSDVSFSKGFGYTYPYLTDEDFDREKGHGGEGKNSLGKVAKEGIETLMKGKNTPSKSRISYGDKLSYLLELVQDRKEKMQNQKQELIDLGCTPENTFSCRALNHMQLEDVFQMVKDGRAIDKKYQFVYHVGFIHKISDIMKADYRNIIWQGEKYDDKYTRYGIEETVLRGLARDLENLNYCTCSEVELAEIEEIIQVEMKKSLSE